MFLEPQKQFALQMKDHLEKHLRGEPLNLEPGYAEAYVAWEAENKELLYKLSAEERTQSFADYLQIYVHDELIKLVHTDEEKELANRGELLLVSRDGGAHFDSFLTPKEQAEVKATDYTVLSPTFRSATTNFKELREEQTYLTAITKLRDAHYLVLGIDFVKKQIHVSHPKFGLDDVPVNLDTNVKMPLMADFIEKEAQEPSPNTQLPEAHGTAEQDVTLEVPSMEEEVMRKVQVDDQKENAEKSIIAALAAAAAIQSINANRDVATRAQEAARNAKENIERPLLAPGSDRKLPTVMASKNAMAARFARHSKSTDDSKKSEAAHKEKAQKEQDEQARQRQEKEEEQQASQKNEGGGAMALAKGAGIGIGAFGSALAGLGATGFIVTDIVLRSS